MRILVPRMNGRMSTSFFEKLFLLSVAVLSGLWLGGIGDAVVWFCVALGIVALLGVSLARHLADTDTIGVSSTRKVVLHQHLIITVLLFSICSTVALAWLGVHRQPLPLVDLRTSGLVMVLFSLMSIGLVVTLLRLPLVSFPTLFLGITFLFTSSAFVLYPFEGPDAFRGWNLVHMDSVFLAMPLVMLAFSSFSVGALLWAARHFRGNAARSGQVNHTHSDTLRKIGFVLFILSVVVIAYYSSRGFALRTMFEGGYHSFRRSAEEMPTLLRVALARFLPWSLLILIAASKDRRTYLNALLLSIPACGIMLMMGDRSNLLTVILLIASGSYLLGLTMDWKRSLAIVALVAFLVPLTINIRNTPVREWSAGFFIRAVTNQVEGRFVAGESSIMVTGLSNMGATYQTLMGTVMLVPDSEPYRYGLDYLRPLAVAVPLASRLFPAIGVVDDLMADQPTMWITRSLNSNFGLGFNQLAEAYLQFGTAGVIGLYVILGWVLPHLWWSLGSGDLDSRKLALVLIFMTALLTWIRNDCSGVIRAFLWGWVLIYALPAVLVELRQLGTRAEGRQGE